MPKLHVSLGNLAFLPDTWAPEVASLEAPSPFPGEMGKSVHVAWEQQWARQWVWMGLGRPFLSLLFLSDGPWHWAAALLGMGPLGA